MSRKKCTGCGDVKDYAEFSRDKTKKDGLQCRCKSCNRRYREEHRERLRECNRRYYRENREALRECSRRYNEENREAVLERNRRYREEHRERLREYHRRYNEEHREVLTEVKSRRQKKINDALRGIATRNREPWTPAEDTYIMSEDEPLALMAMELGRTINSVRSRAAKLRKKTAA